MHSIPENFDIGATAEAGGIQVQVRRYHGLSPDETISMETRNLVGMLLPPHPRMLQVRYADSRTSTYVELGSTVFRPREVPWVVMTNAGQVQTVICAFDDHRFRDTIGAEPEWTNNHLKECLDLRSIPIAQMLRTMQAEAEAPGFASDALIESCGTAILVHLARYLRERPAGRGWRDRSRLTSAQMRRIDDYLEQVTGRAPNVGELAQACGISSRHLLRKIKQTTGMGVSAYINQAQITKAKRLLDQRDLPLKEIAFRLGFACHSNFTAAFRKSVGQCPSEYRNRH